MLTLVGIYGVAAYSVGQRIPELGVRVALGAARGRILGLVVRDVLGQVLLGVAIGLAARLRRHARARRAAVPGRAHRPRHLRDGAVLLLLAAALAALGPALRATRIDPVTALRWE